MVVAGLGCQNGARDPQDCVRLVDNIQVYRVAGPATMTLKHMGADAGPGCLRLLKIMMTYSDGGVGLRLSEMRE